MDDRRLLLVIGLLIICVGVLAYLEWWRAGELANLAGRLSRLEQPKPRAKPAAKEASP